MPIIRHAPRRAIGHWTPYYFGNSKAGIKKTHAHGITWHDLDHGITKGLPNGKRGRWRISHGNPEKVFFKGKRMRNYTAAQLAKMSYRGFRPGGPTDLYRYAKKLGVKIEIEPKGKDLRYTDVTYWRTLAAVCRRVWGLKWPAHTYVKVSDAYGKQFAVDVIKAASEAGFNAGPLRDWDVPADMI